MSRSHCDFIIGSICSLLHRKNCKELTGSNKHQIADAERHETVLPRCCEVSTHLRWKKSDRTQLLWQLGRHNGITLSSTSWKTNVFLLFAAFICYVLLIWWITLVLCWVSSFQCFFSCCLFLLARVLRSVDDKVDGELRIARDFSFIYQLRLSEGRQLPV